MRLFEIEQNNGIFIGLKFAKMSENKLYKYIESLNLKNPIDKNDLHITLIHSETNFNYEPIEFSPQKIDKSTFEFKILGNNCLTIVFKNKWINDRNKFLMSQGATSDYPSYLSHFTLSYDFTDEINFELPDFDLYVDEEYQEKLIP